jgi:hypothetical protein
MLKIIGTFRAVLTYELGFSHISENVYLGKVS